MPFILFSQSYMDTTDFTTNGFGTPVIRGTAVLIGSPNNYYSMMDGYRLTDIYSADCENTGMPDDWNKKEFISATIDSTKYDWADSVVINIQIIANCCTAFLGELEIVEDSIISLNYYEFGTHCECSCCTGLTYVIFVWDLKSIKYFMIQNDKGTLIRKEDLLNE